MRHIIILGIVALVPTMASADAIVRIRSDQPASAYLDGKLAGSAPLTISKLKSGSHTVKVENVETGEVKIYNIYSPAGATAEKDIDVAFNAQAPAPVVQQDVAPTREVVQTTVVQPQYVQQVQPVVYQQAPVVYYNRPSYGRSYSYDRAYLRAQQEQRDKVRSRNVLLGAAVANEVFNKGSSKGTFRGVTVGGALLNEVLRSGR